METYVSGMIESNSIGWMPVHRALVLKTPEDSANNIDKQIQDILERVIEMKTTLKKRK